MGTISDPTLNRAAQGDGGRSRRPDSGVANSTQLWCRVLIWLIWVSIGCGICRGPRICSRFG